MSRTTPAAAPQVDPRGLRFSAAITSVVLAAVLLLPSPVAVPLLAVQVAIFAISSTIGLSASPYAALFRRLVRPRIGAPAQTEDARPPHFAQVVGLVFTAAGLASLLAEPTSSGSCSWRSRSSRHCSTPPPACASVASCT
jgi:hypothetical protein